MARQPTEMREERRIVTALFADIVGSTAISERLDPEDAREVLGDAVARVIDQVDALGGTVKDLAGDGVLALFGAPVAHEDDAERAVLCGLRIVAAIADDADDVAETWGVEEFSVRVGIETGRAVLGPVGGGSRVEYGATGDAINVAARLQSHAEPGTVLVGETTRAMIEDRFAWGATQAYALKGKEQPVKAAPAIAYAPRPHVPIGAVGAPLVAREKEMERLIAGLDELRGGRGRVIAIVGEAGLGKSRLVNETRERFASTVGGTWLDGNATSYATSIPYLPYRHLFLSWLGVPFDAPPGDVDRAIQAAAGRSATAGDALRRLQPMLTAASEDATVDPERGKEEVFAAIGAVIDELATDRAVVVALEDLHWSDATSLALTERLAALAGTRPIQFLTTARPEAPVLEFLRRLEETLGDDLVRLDLQPMSREGDRRLLRALVGEHTLPRSFEERFVDTTDGNPFFVEEQVRALVGAGALRRADHTWTFTGSVEVALAPTVERALLARIDRLDQERRDVLLAASVLGARFDPDVLAAVADRPVAEAVHRLTDDGFLDEPADGRVRFRHALVQEAAYGSLLKRRRRELHARAAAALETAYAGRASEIAATLGRHLAGAGDAERAVGFLREAARKALADFANEEAAALAADALALLPTDAGAVPDRLRGEAIDLCRIEGDALGLLARYDEAVEAYRRAVAFTPTEEQLERASLWIRAARRLGDAHLYDEALGALDRADAELEGRVEDEAGFAVWLEVEWVRASVFYWRMDEAAYAALVERVEPLVEARGTLEQRQDFYETHWGLLVRRDRFVVSDETLRMNTESWRIGRESEDPGVRAWAGFVHGFSLLWHRDLDEAEPLLRWSLEESERLGDTLLHARALTYLLVCTRLQGNAAAAEEMVDATLEASRHAGLPEYEAIAHATAAWIAFRRGDSARVRDEAERAVDLLHAIPNPYPFDWMAYLPLVGTALGEGDVDEACRCVEPMLGDTQQALKEPLGQLLRDAVSANARGARDEAAALLARAIETAHRSAYL